MKKAEKILAVLIVVALVFRLLSLPGSFLLLVFSFPLLAIIYNPFGFAFFNNIRLRNIFKGESYKGVTVFRIIAAVITGIGLSLICIGSLFTIQQYPGADILIMSGFTVSVIILIASLANYVKTKKEFFSRILIRNIIVGAVGVFIVVFTDLFAK